MTWQTLAVNRVLRPDGLHTQTASWDGDSLTVDGAATPGELSTDEGYFVSGLPVEMHCHGMGTVDFSDFATLDLVELNSISAAEGVLCVPTLYLRHHRLDEFVAFMRTFDALRKRGLLPYVPGVALEGPLLASHGGTPAATVWPPTKREWEILAGLGRLGLVYVVMSPDALTPGSDLYDRLDRDHPDMAWIVRMLVQNGVRPALGHFTRTDPTGSAALVNDLVATAWETETDLVGARVVTDHLFNDMPLKIKHSFRTRRARAERNATIAAYDLPSWNLADLPEQVGPVPAAIMRLCHEGLVSSCINFDGEHVDLAIAKRAVEVIGGRNIMLMTDRCDSARLGGQQLARGTENSLWYQEGGIVAAGSQPLDQQIANARSVDVSEPLLWNLISFTAYEALGLDRDPWLGPAGSGCFVLPSDGGRQRTAVLSGPAEPARASC
jgi:N-acetylglucosamine-6-phosphate deacetylase